MNRKFLRLMFKVVATWLLMLVFAASIMALNSPILGFVIVCAFFAVAARLQEKVVFKD